MLEFFTAVGRRVTPDQTAAPNADRGPIVELESNAGPIGFRLRLAGSGRRSARAATLHREPPGHYVGQDSVVSVQHCRPFVQFQPSSAVDASLLRPLVAILCTAEQALSYGGSPHL